MINRCGCKVAQKSIALLHRACRGVYCRCKRLGIDGESMDKTWVRAMYLHPSFLNVCVVLFVLMHVHAIQSIPLSPLLCSGRCQEGGQFAQVWWRLLCWQASRAQERGIWVGNLGRADALRIIGQVIGAGMCMLASRGVARGGAMG